MTIEEIVEKVEKHNAGMTNEYFSKAGIIDQYQRGLDSDQPFAVFYGLRLKESKVTYDINPAYFDVEGDPITREEWLELTRGSV